MVTCAALALVAGAAAVTGAACVRTPSCPDLVEEESWAAAKVSCRAELDAGGSAETAPDLGRALMNSGDDAGALEMAMRALQAGPSTAALRVAGTAQDRLGGSTNIAAGREKLHAALAASEEEGDDDGVARAALALAGSFWRESRFEAVDRWLRAAETTAREPEPRTRGTVAIRRGDLQRRLGDADGAEATYARAEQHLGPFPTKLGWLLLKRGKLHLERGSPSAARPLFEEALQIADAAGQADVQRAARVSLAEIARLEGDTAEGFSRLEGWSGARPSNYLRALALLHVAQGDAARAGGPRRGHRRHQGRRVALGAALRAGSRPRAAPPCAGRGERVPRVDRRGGEAARRAAGQRPAALAAGAAPPALRGAVPDARRAR
ncbi:MAG: hypothetical protein WKG00_34425 [Polyangiaceae bacterium]